MNYQPFQITAEILTPFHMRHPVTLDALLSAAITNQTGLVDEATIERIPLEMESGIFKASSLQAHRRPVVMQIGRVQALRGPVDLSTRSFAPNAKRGTASYIAIDRQRGPYKSSIDAYEAISCTSVYWYGVGDPDACHALLTNYLLGIGKRANAGAGELGNIEVFLLDEDYSWVLPNGKPARPLPVDLWNSIGGEAGLPTAPLKVTVPYPYSEPTLAVFPTL